MFVRRPSAIRFTVPLGITTLASLAGCPQLAEDGTDDGATESAITPVSELNTAPIANAGEDQTIVAGERVTLNGTGSSDPDGDRLGFIWRQLSGAPQIVLVDGFSAAPQFFAPNVSQETIFSFRLTVVDGLAVSTDDVSITVQPQPE